MLVEAGTRSRIYCCAPQVRPAHVGSRDPDDGIRRLHDRWRGALFEADVARTVKNRAPHVSLLCLAIHSANLFTVLLVADLFEPVDILSAQRFLNGDRRVSRRATKATAMHSVPIIRRKSATPKILRQSAHPSSHDDRRLARNDTDAVQDKIVARYRLALRPRSKCSLL